VLDQLAAVTWGRGADPRLCRAVLRSTLYAVQLAEPPDSGLSLQTEEGLLVVHSSRPQTAHGAQVVDGLGEEFVALARGRGLRVRCSTKTLYFSAAQVEELVEHGTSPLVEQDPMPTIYVWPTDDASSQLMRSLRSFCGHCPMIERAGLICGHDDEGFAYVVGLEVHEQKVHDLRQIICAYGRTLMDIVEDPLRFELTPSGSWLATAAIMVGQFYCRDDLVGPEIVEQGNHDQGEREKGLAPWPLGVYS
jgi:hypothetical protein